MTNTNLKLKYNLNSNLINSMHKTIENGERKACSRADNIPQIIG